MANDRDKWTDKHPATPAGGVRPVKPIPRDPFGATPTVDASATAAELARRERDNAFGGDTPITDTSALLARTYDRAKSASTSADSVRLEIEGLKAGATQLSGLVMSLARDVATLNGSVQTLTAETQAQRAERVDRERRAETRAEEHDRREAERELRELEDRRAKRRQILGIWVPTITALGALCATVITALRDPNVKYVPQVPNTPTQIERGSGAP